MERNPDFEHAERVAEAMQPAYIAATRRVQGVLGRVVTNSTLTARHKIIAIHKAVDILSEVIRPVSACKNQCSHCCYQPAEVYEEEAKLIAEFTGATMRTKAPGEVFFLDEFSYDNPCPWLKDGACSIYSVRPGSCRQHFSLAKSGDLCKPDGRFDIQVPLANLTWQSELMMRLFPDAPSDVRFWFGSDADIKKLKVLHV